MKRITLKWVYLVFSLFFFLLHPSDNIYALEDQERGFMNESGNFLTRSKSLRGRRKGFICGFGVGVGRTSFTEPLAEYYWRNTNESNESTARYTRSVLVTELKIGHGLHDQFLLYYTSRISWLPLQHFYRDTVVANGTAAMGLMYFPFKRPRIYLVGSIGLAALVTWQPPLRLENARQTGVAVSGGIGYEFISHLSIDLTVNFGNASMSSVDDLREISVTDEVVTFAITLNALAY